MLKSTRIVSKRISILIRMMALILPVVCIMLLLSQTAFAKTTYLINDGGRVVIHTTMQMKMKKTKSEVNSPRFLIITKLCSTLPL